MLNNVVLDRQKAANIQRNMATRQSSETLVRLVQTKLCGPKYVPKNGNPYENKDWAAL